MNQKKKSHFFKKFLIVLALGLTLGLCIGLGLYTVNLVSKHPLFVTGEEDKRPPKGIVEETIDEIKERFQGKKNAPDSSEDMPSQKAENEPLENPENKPEIPETPSTELTEEKEDNKPEATAQPDFRDEVVPLDEPRVPLVTGVVTDVTQVVDKVMPSMVSITNLFTETYSYWGRQYSQEQEASGSGIIVGENDSEYLIVTNYHVIEANKQLTVFFADGSQAAAYEKGYDDSIDIAVLAVQKADLTADTKNAISIAVMGDSTTLKIGEPAIAIGNALGYGQSVTTGVISALNRDINMENTCTNLIQTSAAINPGNSGGALLNIYGDVIGINSNKIGGNAVEGMGYAIPISEVKDTIEAFMSRETRYQVASEERGYIGINGATVDDSLSMIYGIPKGVYVTGIYQDSAAGLAGIEVGDVITKIDGQSISELSELQELLTYYRGGDTITVTIMRAGVSGYDEYDIEVTLSNKPSNGG